MIKSNNKVRVIRACIIYMSFFLITGVTYTQDPRNMMWVEGAGPLSNSWLSAETALENFPYGYDYNHILFSTSYNPELGVIEAKNLLLQTIQS